jgi:hypothetical protein
LLQKLHLGNQAPVFTLIRALDQHSDGDHLVMEAAMEFASGDDMSAEMSVALLPRRFGGFRTTFYISKLHIEGKVKIAVKFANGWPVIGRIRFCFAHPPYVQMTARPMYKGMMDVTYIPGAAGWLEATLVSALEQSLVEPNMLVVDVEKLAANNVMLPNFVPEQSTVPLTASVDNKQSTSIAIVHIEILSAKQLRAADRNGLSDPFVAISLGPSSRKTTVKKKTLNPTWNEKFQLPISSWDLPNILILRVRDKDIVFHDELGSCTVCVSDYQDGEWHEENLPLEVKLKREIKKVGQLHFRIMVEKSAILEPFEDNQSSVTGSLRGSQELYTSGNNTISTELSPPSTDTFIKRLKNDQASVNNASGDQKQKGKISHSRSSSAGGGYTETQTLVVPDVAQQQQQPRQGEVSEIIDVPIGPRGAFTILHPGKASPRKWPIQKSASMRRGGNSQEKVKYEGPEVVRKSGLLKIFHRRRESTGGGGSQESIPAIEKESDQSFPCSSVEHSRELLPPHPPEHNGTVRLILEPNTVHSIAPDEPPDMNIHPQTLTPILSNQKRDVDQEEDDEDEDEDDETWTPEQTPKSIELTPGQYEVDNSDSQTNGTPAVKSKRHGWLGKMTKIRLKRKPKTHSDINNNNNNKDIQVVNSPEMLYSDEFGDRELNYNNSIFADEDEPPIHEDEKKIINSSQSQRGSSLRSISEKTLAKLGLGPKKPSQMQTST